MAKESSDEAASTASQKLLSLEEAFSQTKAAHEQTLLKQMEQANQMQRQLEVCLVLPFSKTSLFCSLLRCVGRGLGLIVSDTSAYLVWMGSRGKL